MGIVGSLKEVYENKNILYSMVVRNLKGKYKNSYLGFAWHFVTPVIMITIFYVVFTGIMQREIDNYWVYLCVGMFPFSFFQHNMGQGSGCLVLNAATIKKMYFPREIIVLSQVISTFVTMIIAYSVVISLMFLSGYPFYIPALLFLPILLVLSAVFVVGYVLILSAVTVYVRDVQYFVEAISRIIFWVTPVFYLVEGVTGLLKYIILFNPFAYYIMTYHDILYYHHVPNMLQFGICCLLSVSLFITGLFVFNRLKGKFAERL